MTRMKFGGFPLRDDGQIAHFQFVIVFLVFDMDDEFASIRAGVLGRMEVQNEDVRWAGGFPGRGHIPSAGFDGGYTQISGAEIS